MRHREELVAGHAHVRRVSADAPDRDDTRPKPHVAHDLAMAGPRIGRGLDPETVVPAGRWMTTWRIVAVHHAC
jgi:hypothetical protein